MTFNFAPLAFIGRPPYDVTMARICGRRVASAAGGSPERGE